MLKNEKKIFFKFHRKRITEVILKFGFPLMLRWRLPSASRVITPKQARKNGELIILIKRKKKKNKNKSIIIFELAKKIR